MAKQKTENQPAEDTHTAESQPAGDAGALQFAFMKLRWLPIALLILVVLSVAGIMYYNTYQDDLQEEAADQATFAFEAFLRDSFQLAVTGDGQNPGFELLVDEYGSTPTGNLCRFYLGACYLNLDRYEEGVKMLQAYKKGDNLYAQAAFKGIAFGYEELGDFTKAANAYLQAGEVLDNEETKPYFLFEAARTYELAGNREKALEIYTRLYDLYPNATEASQAEKDIARLNASSK